MTQLAKEIAYDKDAAIITDNIKFDNYTNLSRTFLTRDQKRDQFAKGIINLLVPQNLSQISFRKLIKFRNNNRDLIRAFNKELANVQDFIGDGLTERKFVERFNNIYSEISRTVLVPGVGIASIPFAAYILMNNPHALVPEYIKEILGGLGVILAGIYSLNKLLSDTKNIRYCKKYLINIERLK
jgi:hypothetical protein